MVIRTTTIEPSGELRDLPVSMPTRTNRFPEHLARLGYRAVMDPGKAWAVRTAARAIARGTHPDDARHYFWGAVRAGIVFG